MNDREAQRLAALASYEIMDTPAEASFDEIVDLAARLCDAPIAMINLIGEHRQFFKAAVMAGDDASPAQGPFCLAALAEDEFLLVPDALQDCRFAGDPLVTGEPHVRFYAGALLKSEDGHAIGTLCVLDTRPRELTLLQRDTIRILARQVMTQL